MSNFKKICILLFAIAWTVSYGKQGLAAEAAANEPSPPVHIMAEQPVPPEINPPGDIPDSQVFIKYKSMSGAYELDVPEGWARKTHGADVFFSSKLDGLSVTISGGATNLDVRSVREKLANRLKKKERAVIIKNIESIRRKHGHAIRIVYESNSEPNPVTDKQVRLENEIYVFHGDGKLAELRLWAPVGADNVDQWSRISNSFRWR
jgi:hypothetical protein